MEEDRRRRFPVFFLLFLLLVIGGGIFGILRIRQYVTHRMEVLEQSNPDPVAEALAAKLVSGDFQGFPSRSQTGRRSRERRRFGNCRGWRSLCATNAAAKQRP